MLEAGVLDPTSLTHTDLIHTVAAANWSLSGSIWTFAFPMLLFAVAATVLYRVLWWPHRIPGHSDLAPASAAPPGPATAQDNTVTAQDNTATAQDSTEPEVSE